MRLSAALALFALALPGCSTLSALGGGPSRDVFELLPQGTGFQCSRAQAGELVVEQPKARSTLDSDRIMIRPSDLQVQYLPDAQWGDKAPEMLRTMLVRALKDTGAFTNVGRAPLGVAGDLALLSEVNDFNAMASGRGAVVRLSVDAQMLRESSGRIASRGRFVAEAPAASTGTADLVAAFEVASRDLVTQMTEWSLRAAGVNPATCRQGG